MQSSENRELDRGLAALRGALEDVHVPSRVRSGIDVAATLARGDRPSPARSTRRWNLAGIAASLLVAAMVFTRPPAPVDGPNAGAGLEIRPEYIVIPARVPIRVHSVANGTEVRFVAAQIVRDERGVTRAVYLDYP